MYKGRSTHDWNQTSLLAAITVNVHRTKRGKCAKPSDFNPHSKEHESILLDKHGMKELKKQLTRGK